MKTPGKLTIDMPRTLALTLGLALLAVVGNVLVMPLFFGVSFIFGSVAVMLAVALLGTLPALLVGVAGGLYTLLLWGHPYALIIFSLEALLVGLLYRRGLRNLVMADLIYWLVVGAPLVLLFYRGVIGMSWDAAGLIALKQPLNGVFNALIAGLLLLALQLIWRGARNWGLAPPRLASLQFHVLLASILLAGGVPLIHEGYSQRTQQEHFLSQLLEQQGRWLLDELSAAPADRTDWQRQLARRQQNTQIGLALIGPKDELVASQGVVASIGADAGELQILGDGLAIWLPSGKIPTMPRWKLGRYLLSIPVQHVPGISQLRIEHPAAPLVAALERGGITLFVYLVVLLMLGIVVSRMLSDWLTRPIVRLQAASAGLSQQIAGDRHPTLPESPVLEYDHLSSSLHEMASRLAISFQEMRQVQAGLEQQVQTRTAELNQFKSTLDRTLDCVFMFDAKELNFFYANAGALLQVGYSREELLSMHPYDIKPFVSKAQFQELVAPLLEGRQASLTFETVHQHKNGQQLPVEIFLQYIAPSDEPARFVAIVRDITERKQAESERNRISNLLSNVLEAASEVSIIATDATGLITSFNRGAQRMLGYSADDMVNKQSPAIIHLPEEVVARAAELSSELGQPVEGFRVFVEMAERLGSEKREWTYVHKDGHHIPVSLVVTTMRDQHGEIIGYLGMAEDITERKRAETTLRDQAEHTQAILDNVVDGLITIDQTGIINSFNPAAEYIFGYTAEEVLGRNVRMLMPNPHRDSHDGYLRNYQATGVARIIGIGREVEGQRKDGSLFEMELAVSEITRQGMPMYVGMVRDISERKRVDRMKSEFVSTVSHELRTPLTSISGALGLISGGAVGAISEQAQEMIRIAHKNSERLTHLINDLLDIEKLAAGKLYFDMQVQPLMPLILQALEANKAYGAERGVQLCLTGEAPDINVWVDGQRLMQVLSNLLSNAVKYSPENDQVEVAVEPHDQYVRVKVTDHGPGVPSEFHDRIFQKFAQADSSDTRQKGGTGLGLAITRELLEHMDGEIAYESREGHGACFYFDLPVRGEQARPGTSSLLASMAADGPRILVVEDEPDAAHLLGLMLGRAGYTVDTVYNGAQALHALRTGRYAAVSLDLMLPDMSGLEIIRHLRQQAETVDLPILVVSAKMEEGRLAINGDFSNIDWLAKPIDENRLLMVVERMIPVSSEHHPRVLHVEDDADLHRVVRGMVGERFDFELATTLEEASARVALERFDVVILDLGLPDGSGWDLLPLIRAQQPHARVVILSGTDMSADEVQKVEAALLKSQVSPHTLLDAIRTRIDTQSQQGRK